MLDAGPVHCSVWLSESSFPPLLFACLLLGFCDPTEAIRATLQPLWIVRIGRFSDLLLVLC